jgi:hypothetical protein
MDMDCDMSSLFVGHLTCPWLKPAHVLGNAMLMAPSGVECMCVGPAPKQQRYQPHDVSCEQAPSWVG